MSVIPDAEESWKVAELHDLVIKYLNVSNQGSENAREYLGKAEESRSLLVRFLQANAMEPPASWDALKQYAEARFDMFPELFPTKLPYQVLRLLKSGRYSVLKQLDAKGRRVIFWNARDWNPEECTLDHAIMAGIFLLEMLLQDDIHCRQNGFVFVQNCEGMGLRHLKNYTFDAMRKIVHIFWHTSPLQTCETFFVNVPTLLNLAYRLLRRFLPTELKHVVVTPQSKGFTQLHESVPKEILPKVLGGPLDDKDVPDEQFYPD